MLSDIPSEEGVQGPAHNTNPPDTNLSNISTRTAAASRLQVSHTSETMAHNYKASATTLFLSALLVKLICFITAH